MIFEEQYNDYVDKLICFHDTLRQKNNLKKRFKIITEQNHTSISPRNIILQRTIKEVVEFGDEELIFDYYNLIIEKSPSAYDLILELLESLYNPSFLREAGIRLIQDLKLNFLNIYGKKLLPIFN